MKQEGNSLVDIWFDSCDARCDVMHRRGLGAEAPGLSAMNSDRLAIIGASSWEEKTTALCKVSNNQLVQKDVGCNRNERKVTPEILDVTEPPY